MNTNAMDTDHTVANSNSWPPLLLTLQVVTVIIVIQLQFYCSDDFNDVFSGKTLLLH